MGAGLPFVPPYLHPLVSTHSFHGLLHASAVASQPTGRPFLHLYECRQDLILLNEIEKKFS